MRELGVHSDDAHAGVGRRAAELGIDVLVGVGAGGRGIAGGADGIPDVLTAADAADALRIVQGMAQRRRRGPREGQPGRRARGRRAAALGGGRVIAMLMAATTAFLLTFLITPVLIRRLRRQGIGQQIRDDGPIEHPHVAKAGTPTMGGIAMVVAMFVAYVVAHIRHDDRSRSRARVGRSWC